MRLLWLGWTALFSVFLACGPVGKAKKQYDEGAYQEAAKEAQAALAADSSNAAAWVLLAQSYTKLQKPDSAIQAYDNALRYKKDDASIKNGLAALYVDRAAGRAKRENVTGALADFERAQALQPSLFDIYFQRGVLSFQKAKLESAQADFNQAQALAPDDPRPQEKLRSLKLQAQKAREHFEQGQNYFDAGAWKKAATAFEKAASLQSDAAEYSYALHLARGRYFYKKGSVSDLWEAISEFGLAATLRTGAAAPLYYMAMAYEKKDRNDFDVPIETYERAILAEPDSQYAADARKQIERLSGLKKKLEKFWGKKKQD